MRNLGTDLIESLTDALAHARGETSDVITHAVTLPDVRAIRKKLRLSQDAFAERYRIPLATLKNWEQGRRSPDAPAIAYLTAITNRPDAVYEALQG